MKKQSEMLQYIDNKMTNRNDYIMKLLKNEYTLTFYDICKMLRCSRNYVSKYMMDNVKHIFLNEIIRETLLKEKKISKSEYETIYKSYYYFSEKSFYEYINKIAVATRQTIVINLYDYISADKIKKIKNKKLSFQNKENEMKLLAVSSSIPYADPMHRSEATEIEIENFIVDADVISKMQTIKEMPEPNNERAYRQIYADGRTKIKIFGKSFFIYNNLQSKSNSLVNVQRFTTFYAWYLYN